MHGPRRVDLSNPPLVLALALALACGCGQNAVPGPKPLSPPPPLSADRLAAVLQTEAGAIRCEIEPHVAPRAAAMFVGFARGGVEWLASDGERVKRPLYRDLAFHRAIESVLVQTGCPLSDGTGHPGYRIPIETHPSDEARLATPGALVMATYTPPPGRRDPEPPPEGHVVGSQFGVLLTAAPHLLGELTVLGRCTDLDVARRIAEADASARPRLVSVRTEPNR